MSRGGADEHRPPVEFPSARAAMRLQGKRSSGGLLLLIAVIAVVAIVYFLYFMPS